MDEYRKVIRTGIIILVILVVAVGIYYFFFYKKGKESVTSEEALKKRLAEVAAEESISKEKKGIQELPPVKLDKSDDLVRELAQGLSSQPNFGAWLKTKDLIRKFTAAVDNIANGLSPRLQIEFFTQAEDLKVIKKDRKFYVNPASYERYNLVVDVFDSLNVEECVTFYKKFKPLIQEAYRDLGYPKEDFDQTLFRAIVELLKTPVVRGDILVEKKIVTYMMVDQKLESLSEAQKHLLRMGPENVEIVQAKLLQLARAFGFPESQIPQPKIYSPETRRF